jgi:hypothetical protein
MRRSTWRVLRRAALIGIVPALLIAALPMSMAWDHNPQGEFHEAGVIHWRPWLFLGFVYALPVWLLSAALAIIVLGARREPH